MRIERLVDGDASPAADLGQLLVACVRGGADVGFFAEVTAGEATAWWRSALAEPGPGTLLARTDDDAVVGVVRLVPARMPNGRQRAEVAKLLVHPAVRRGGVATKLLAALEAEALRLGRTTLVLDTVPGTAAERLYLRLGWQRVGEVPAYALDTHGVPAPTVFMTKRLSGPAPDRPAKTIRCTR